MLFFVCFLNFTFNTQNVYREVEPTALHREPFLTRLGASRKCLPTNLHLHMKAAGKHLEMMMIIIITIINNNGDNINIDNKQQEHFVVLVVFTSFTLRCFILLTHTALQPTVDVLFFFLFHAQHKWIWHWQFKKNNKKYSFFKTHTRQEMLLLASQFPLYPHNPIRNFFLMHFMILGWCNDV